MDPLRNQGFLFNIRHHHGHPRPVLLNFCSVKIAKRTKWQTLAILQFVPTRKKLNLPRVCFGESESKCYCYFATRGQTQSNPSHFILAIHDLSSEERWNVVWNIFMGRVRGNREKTWVFIYNMHPIILCHGSMLGLFFAPPKKKPQRDTHCRFHFWPLR